MSRYPTILCIAGPTASGKTALAMKLCDQFPCDIISVDSAQIYKGMDIGTAKPSTACLQKYPHKLIDILDPSQYYSAALFCQDARHAIDETIKEGKVPLLVGGTMLYYKALFDGLNDLPSADPIIRKKIHNLLSQDGNIGLYNALLAIDEKSARKLHLNDTQRLQRALEICMITGSPMSALHQIPKGYHFPYHTLKIAVTPFDRSTLHHNIATRCYDMFANGFIEEVRSLYQRGNLSLDNPAIRSVGYRQIWEYLQGKPSDHSLTDLCIFATRQVAKRQLTWLRKWKDTHWIDSSSKTTALKTACTLVHHTFAMMEA